MWPRLLQADQLHLATCDIGVGPGVNNDTRTLSSFNKDCLSLLPPRPPKPKHMYDHHNDNDDDNDNHNHNHIHRIGIQPRVATPSNYCRGQIKDPTGTAEKKASATQQHLDRIGKLASLAKTSLYPDNEGGRFCSFCTTVSRTAVPGGYQESTAPSRTHPR